MTFLQELLCLYGLRGQASEERRLGRAIAVDRIKGKIGMCPTTSVASFYTAQALHLHHCFKVSTRVSRLFVLWRS